MINMFVYHCIEYYNELFFNTFLAIVTLLSPLSLNQPYADLILRRGQQWAEPTSGAHANGKIAYA